MYYLLFLVLWCQLREVHPIHISVSEVEITSSEIEWIIRIYKDDLMLALYGENASSEKYRDANRVRNDIAKYLYQHIHLYTESSEAIWKLTDIHSDEEALWMTITAPKEIQEGDDFHISNSVLMKEYADQKNIIHFNYNGETKSLTFESGDKAKLVSL